MDLKNKKVLVVSTTENMIANFMIPHIKQMQEMGAEVIVACNNYTNRFNEIEKQTNCVMYDVALTRNPFNLKIFKGYNQLKKIVKQNKIDLIHCLQPVGGFVGRMLAKKFKLPCLYTAHGFHFYKGCPIQNKLIYKTIEKYCAKFTTALVTMNEEDYQASLNMKAKKKYKINGIGVDFSKYKKDESFDCQALREELELTKEDFVLISVGELNENKNTLRLIDSVKEANNPKIKYLICGEGPLKPEYEKKIKENNLENRVKLLGFRTDIPKLLNCVDVYLMPSYREGLSKAMMEAMAYGLPIIGSKIRGNVDLVGENAGGILVSPTDTNGFKIAIEELYSNPELLHRVGKRNREFVQNYSVETVLTQMKQIYEEL